MAQHVRLRRIRTGAGVALGYAGLLVLCHESAQWFITPLDVSLWFPPAALAAALLLAGGVGWWPWVVLTRVGTVLAATGTSDWQWVAVSAVLTTLPYALAALALRRLEKPVDFRRVRETALFVLLTASAALASALLGCGARIARGTLTQADYLPAVLDFWIGDAVAGVTLTPLLYLALRRLLSTSGSQSTRHRASRSVVEVGYPVSPATLDRTAPGDRTLRRTLAEPIGTALLLGAGTWLAFDFAATDGQMLYLVLIPLVAVAVTRDRLTTLSTVLALNLALVLALHDDLGMVGGVRQLQAFLGVLAVTGMGIAAVSGEHARAARNLERSLLRERRAQASLVEARQQFDLTLSRLDDLIWSVEVLRDGQTRLVYSSPNSRGIFGGELPAGGDWISRIGDLVHPGDQAAYRTFVADLVAGEPTEVEVRVVGNDHVARWVWSRAMPRRQDGRLFLDGITTNITERKALAQAQAQLLVEQQEQVRRLKALDAMRDQFLAIAGHELRTPLTAIRGYAELLLQSAARDPETARHAEVIFRRTTQFHRIIEDFFDLATFQSGSVALHVTETDLGELVSELARDHALAGAERGVSVTSEVEPVLVQGDPARLRQVVENLLSNAVKYTPSAGRVHISCRAAAGGAEIRVEDTGIGVPEDELPHLFDRFYRASTADPHDVTGSGLGLAIVKAIVSAHDGEVAVATNETGGLTLTVALPVGVPVQADAPVPALDLR